MEDTIGIDISKDTLDAYWLSSREHRQFCNDKAGAKALAFRARKTEVSRVIFEAKGIYHRCIETGLAQNGISFARVNPRQARRFCEGTGQLAKTDRVDAALLAKMGALLELRADQPKSETLHDLKQLATARLALIKDRTAAKARLTATTHRMLSQQIKRRLKQIERDLSQVTEAIDTIVAADKDLAVRTEILTSIPGIAKITACAILTERPELGHLSGKQAAALAGLATISRQSGKWQGKERIQGDRASVRRAIYLPDIVDTRFNPDMKAKYEQLISAGKCKKLAITAVMRKLIVTANALLQDQRKWGEYPA
ncbi:putative IS110-family transposase [Octadecabacter antarcticus 307]|uniref:Putative IS110-family transposase n=1 Tax=Octadecabacter antarcticus 307 TaxID=391626 RepID=M9R8T8_9RHOB|nr:putative IS110-family transposase [Octadecabacter antarcticus 307]